MFHKTEKRVLGASVKSRICSLKERKLLSDTETEGIINGFPKIVFSRNIDRAKPQGKIGPIRVFWCNIEEKSKKKEREREKNSFIENVERCTQSVVVGLACWTRYREAKGYMTYDWKKHMGWMLMTYEELIGISFACNQERKLQLGMKRRRKW